MEESATSPLNHRREPRVGLLYDERMCRHDTPNGEDHPECPQRIKAIWHELESAGVTQRCLVFGAEEVKDSYVAGVHTGKHVDLIRRVSSRQFNSRRKKIAANFNSIYLNDGSSESAFLAAGGVLRLTEKVATGEINSGVAIVRPPGHHAEHDQAMGFCLFNNVAVAANFLLNHRTDLGIKKILIVDWDVHHGNGTQKMFWNDSHVLFFSVHRFDYGGFYPAGDDGSHMMIGEGLGAGFNINVPWEHGLCGDADYHAVWDHILMPVADSYNPDIILLSGGFDAAMGDPLGGCCVTPEGYSIMLKKLMKFADGKIMMALEGGYNLKTLSKSVLACVNTLLGETSNFEKLDAKPFQSTWRVICKVRHELSPFWPVFSEQLPKELFVGKEKPLIYEDGSSETDSEVELIKDDSDGLEVDLGRSDRLPIDDLIDNVTSPLSKLNIGNENEATSLDSNAQSCLEPMVMADGMVSSAQLWRSHLSKVDIWYGCYGSNMWMPRFLCYIQGGQAEGMQNPCRGSKDKTPPKDILWKMVTHQLFFGRSYTKTWGEGGVAFLHPKTNDATKTHVCLYRITLEQFNDVLLQENLLEEDPGLPLFDLSAIDSVVQNKSATPLGVKEGWYINVLYLGNERGLPIITMTCMEKDAEEFKSGQLPLCRPSKAYESTLVKGLVEGKQLSEEEAVDYLRKATL
ncbi:histone deacetylase 5-like isoform X2 [Wolffia australiana]